MSRRGSCVGVGVGVGVWSRGGSGSGSRSGSRSGSAKKKAHNNTNTTSANKKNKHVNKPWDDTQHDLSEMKLSHAQYVEKHLNRLSKQQLRHILHKQHLLPSDDLPSGVRQSEGRRSLPSTSTPTVEEEGEDEEEEEAWEERERERGRERERHMHENREHVITRQHVSAHSHVTKPVVKNARSFGDRPDVRDDTQLTVKRRPVQHIPDESSDREDEMNETDRRLQQLIKRTLLGSTEFDSPTEDSQSHRQERADDDSRRGEVTRPATASKPAHHMPVASRSEVRQVSYVPDVKRHVQPQMTHHPSTFAPETQPAEVEHEQPFHDDAPSNTAAISNLATSAASPPHPKPSSQLPFSPWLKPDQVLSPVLERSMEHEGSAQSTPVSHHVSASPSRPVYQHLFSHHSSPQTPRTTQSQLIEQIQVQLSQNQHVGITGMAVGSPSKAFSQDALSSASPAIATLLSRVATHLSSLTDLKQKDDDFKSKLLEGFHTCTTSIKQMQARMTGVEEENSDLKKRITSLQEEHSAQLESLMKLVHSLQSQLTRLSSSSSVPLPLMHPTTTPKLTPASSPHSSPLCPPYTQTTKYDPDQYKSAQEKARSANEAYQAETASATLAVPATPSTITAPPTRPITAPTPFLGGSSFPVTAPVAPSSSSSAAHVYASSRPGSEVQIEISNHVKSPIPNRPQQHSQDQAYHHDGIDSRQSVPKPIEKRINTSGAPPASTESSVPSRALPIRVDMPRVPLSTQFNHASQPPLRPVPAWPAEQTSLRGYESDESPINSPYQTGYSRQARTVISQSDDDDDEEDLPHPFKPLPIVRR